MASAPPKVALITGGNRGIGFAISEQLGALGYRLVITARSLTWAYHAAVSATGFATSVIGCGCEAGIERQWSPDETPDGRSGLSILLFAVSGKELAKQIEAEVQRARASADAGA